MELWQHYMGYFYQMFTFTFPRFYVKLDVTMKKLSNLFGNGIKNTLTSFAAALAVVAGTAGLSQKANAAPSFSTMRYIRTDDTRTIPTSPLMNELLTVYKWTKGADSFIFAINPNSINTPLSSATEAYAELVVGGQKFTTKTLAVTGITVPSGGDNMFAGVFDNANGGARISWAVIAQTAPPITVQGLLDTLAFGTIYAGSDPDFGNFFTANAPAAVSSARLQDIIPSPASSLVLGTGVAVAALRRRRPAMEMAH